MLWCKHVKHSICTALFTYRPTYPYTNLSILSPKYSIPYYQTPHTNTPHNSTKQPTKQTNKQTNHQTHTHKQSFMSETMSKVTDLRQRKPLMDIEVDGGLSMKTIAIAAKAGANMIVAGSSVFKSEDVGKAISDLREGVVQNR